MGSRMVCAEPIRIMELETAISRTCEMPSVRIAPLRETAGTPRPNRGEFAMRRHCAARDSSREIKSATRSKSTFSASWASSASRLFKITGTLGMELSRSSRSCKVFCNAAFSAAGVLKRWSESFWLGAVVMRKEPRQPRSQSTRGRELLDMLRHRGRDRKSNRTKVTAVPSESGNSEEDSQDETHIFLSGSKERPVKPERDALRSVLRQFRQALAVTLGRRDHFHLLPVVGKLATAVETSHIGTS